MPTIAEKWDAEMASAHPGGIRRVVEQPALVVHQPPDTDDDTRGITVPAHVAD
jgi:hypothetical protein